MLQKRYFIGTLRTPLPPIALLDLFYSSVFKEFIHHVLLVPGMLLALLEGIPMAIPEVGLGGQGMLGSHALDLS